MNQPRSEHPEPQWQRANWQNLNGIWEFGYTKRFGKKILVPFCPESWLSGIGNTKFIKNAWYRRSIDATEAQLRDRVILHFGAADYFTTVFVNGRKAGTHEGGYTSFSFDITAYLRAGENELTVHCEDDTRQPLYFSGKQSEKPKPYGCMYTRTTGIWQTVWLEYVPRAYLLSAEYEPDAQRGSLQITARLFGQAQGECIATALWEGRVVGRAAAEPEGGAVRLTLPLSETHPWEVGKGGLYDLVLQYGDDEVESYFGLRSLRLDGCRFLINGKSVFQRLILDQGFYPEGIYTAPAEEDLLRDIRLGMDAGFNGARLHQKIFEPRYLYHCDKLGYLAWGEFPSWGGDLSKPELLERFLPQWTEAIRRDRNHPAIVGWCPFNETHDGQTAQTLREAYAATKRLDPGRPCIDASGYVHVVTDIFCVHDYEQDPVRFTENYADFAKGGNGFHDSERGCGYLPGQPMFVSEYGGIAWPSNTWGWGYGDTPEDEAAFRIRYEALTMALLRHPRMFAFCYTQLTDVEQERNGIYTYERGTKVEPAFFREINTRKAAIEEEA
ncbi:MAG: beta-galactosidase [Oscillospiraceae bacterium]|jgi:beta-galactosidase/beta-glucuronidase|nr:beta-galactosidase [Oscillospiraceae bacterium]